METQKRLHCVWLVAVALAGLVTAGLAALALFLLPNHVDMHCLRAIVGNNERACKEIMRLRERVGVVSRDIWGLDFCIFGRPPWSTLTAGPGVFIRLRVHHFVPTTYLTCGYRSPGAGQPGRRKAGIGILGPDPYYRKTFG